MWFRRKQGATEARRSQETSSEVMRVRRRIVVIAASSVIAIAVVALSVVKFLDQPVQSVQVVGQFHRVSPLQVEQAVMPFRHQGFVSIPLSKLKQAIEAIAWVDHARIERSWPSGLLVYVTEQIPGARWGDRGLLNSRGELFLRDARFVPPELPRLDGPEGTETQVAHLYLETYQRLAGVGLRLARVQLDDRGAWALTVTSGQSAAANNGIEVRLGRLDVNARLERFIHAASPVIAARAAEVSYVDMRYSNGFAVGWARTTRGDSLANSTTTVSKRPQSDG
jgi:cell division protein FtsQ